MAGEQDPAKGGPMTSSAGQPDRSTDAAGGGTDSAGIAASLSSREWDQLTDIVVRRLERRLADELARRGRRSTPGVF
jgi:hypothetical protein